MTLFSTFHSIQNRSLFLVAQKILITLQQQKHLAYFVGGSVRDALLNRTIREIDIATSALPEEIMALFPQHKPVGAHFGVILVTMGNFTFDIATFRKDGEYQDGRRPTSVSFTDAKQDAQRRDLTINGLFYDPITDSIIDYVQGINDIKQKVIRTIGDPIERFKEDKLRMLRCIRFLSQLKSWDFQIEPHTLNAITTQSDSLKLVSKERIREELIKIIANAKDTEEIQLLFDTKLAYHIFPTKQLTDKASRFFTLLIPHNVDFCLKYLSLVLKREPNPLLLNNINQFFLLTTKEQEIIKEQLKWLLFSSEWEQAAPHIKKRVLRTPYIGQILTFLDVWASVYSPEKQPTIQAIQAFYKEEKANLFPPVYITGDTLISKGLKPSPVFRKILEKIENEQLEGNIKTQTQALSYLDDILNHNK